MPTGIIPTRDLGAEIATARKRRRLTQADVARLSNGRVSQQNLSAIEAGRVKRPEPETLDALAEVLNLDALDLKMWAGILTSEEVQKQRDATMNEASRSLLEIRLAHLRDQLNRIPEHYMVDVLEALMWLPSLSEESQARVIKRFKEMIEKEKTKS
ncbi:MAG: transcriptional regulator [Acidobacteriales bacterium]|nr:transcriptional regulator [Terriglobales bacterium]